MATGFLVSFIATFVLMIITVANMRRMQILFPQFDLILTESLAAGLFYYSVVHMCVSTKPVAEIKAVWASPVCGIV